MYKFYKLTALSGLLILGACSHNNHHFSPRPIENDTQSVIYIFRPDTLANRFTTADILLNGTRQFKLNNNHYDYLLVNKGSHRLQLELPQRFTGKQHIELQVEAAQHYYIELTTSTQFQMNQPYIRRFDMQLVDEEAALPQISQLNTNTQQTQTSLPPASMPAEETQTPAFSISKTRDPFH